MNLSCFNKEVEHSAETVWTLLHCISQHLVFESSEKNTNIILSKNDSDQPEQKAKAAEKDVYSS